MSKPKKQQNWLMRTCRTWNHITAVIVTIGGFMLAQILAAILIAIITQTAGMNTQTLADKVNNIPAISLIYAMLSYGLHIVIISSFLRWCGHSLRDIGLRKLRPTQEIVLYTAAGYIVYFVCIIVMSIFLRLFVPSVDLNQKQAIGPQQGLGLLALLAVFVRLVILPPIAEEIATRGFLYTGLRKKMPIIWAGLVTGIVFAVAHLPGGEQGAPLLWAAAIDTFILSAILVYVREKTDSLLPAIGIHMIKNLVAFSLIFIF